MPHVSIRIPDHQLADWKRQAHARGTTLSAFIRDRPDLTDTDPTHELDDIRHRLERLERLAGLD